MIEWGNAWATGITYRREHNQDVGGFFTKVNFYTLVICSKWLIIIGEKWFFGFVMNISKYLKKIIENFSFSIS